MAATTAQQTDQAQHQQAHRARFGDTNGDQFGQRVEMSRIVPTCGMAKNPISSLLISLADHGSVGLVTQLLPRNSGTVGVRACKCP